MRIGVFGGSFNPVHNSHILIVKDAISKLSLDKLIVVPNYSHPKKVDENILNPNARLDMLNIAFSDIDVEVSRIEIDREGLSYTYDTLEEINSIYSGSEIVYITGSDTLSNIENWYMGKEILRKYEIAYFDREGFDISDKITYLEKEYGDNLSFIDTYIPPISSKMVREKVRNNESISEFVPKNVEEYILKNGLYKD